jgi:hypothetical protein
MCILIIPSRRSSHVYCLALWPELDFPLECAYPTMATFDVLRVGWDAVYTYLFWLLPDVGLGMILLQVNGFIN